MMDTDGLLETFIADGVVPLSVRVQEIQHLENALAKQEMHIGTYTSQLNEMDSIFEASRHSMTAYGIKNHEKSRGMLQGKLDAVRVSIDALRDKLIPLREATISTFTPLLARSVDRANARFADHSDTPDKIDALNQIERSCRALVCTEPLRQALDLESGSAASSVECLFELLAGAERARAPLASLAAALAAAAGAQSEVRLGPLKGVPRCLQKAQDDYLGEYTRLADLARATVIFDDVTSLSRALQWLLQRAAREQTADAHKASFEAKRAKDRMSLVWNAELSGGNRDVMVQGVLSWRAAADGGKAPAARATFVVELQLHLRSLFELKHDLHTLYAGLRVLGLAEDEVALHEGQLTDKALSSAERGITRKLHCNYAPVADASALARLLQADPCLLLELRLAGEGTSEKPRTNALNGWTLSKLLLAPVGPGTLMCTRLRQLVLARRGLRGKIPGALGKCIALIGLGLNGNELDGAIPPELGTCRELSWLYLQDNALSGAVPVELARCTRLSILQLQNNPQLKGGVPAEVAELPELHELRYGDEDPK